MAAEGEAEAVEEELTSESAPEEHRKRDTFTEINAQKKKSQCLTDFTSTEL